MFSTHLSFGWTELVGWALVHSLWQSFLLAAVYFVLAPALQAAKNRYRLGMTLLVIALLAPLVTSWVMFGKRGIEPTSMASAWRESAFSNTRLPAVDTIDENKADDLPFNELAQSTAEKDLSFGVLATETSTAKTYVTPTPETRQNRLIVIRESIFSWVRPKLPVLVWYWLIGVTIMSFRPLLGVHIVHKLSRANHDCVGQSVSEMLERVRKDLRIEHVVRGFSSSLVAVPVVVGFFRPIILIPASAVTCLSPSELEMVIRHELAHVFRRDAVVNFTQTLIETIFFYHPAVWWLSHQIRIERENCCDDMAAKSLQEKVMLAKALLQLEEARPASSILASNGGKLKARIERLLLQPSHQPQLLKRRGRISTIAAIAFTMAFVCVSIVSSMLANSTKAEPVMSESAHVGQPNVAFSLGNPELVEFKTIEDLATLPGETTRLRFVGDRYEFDGKVLREISIRFPGLVELDLEEVRSLKDQDLVHLDKLTQLECLRIRFAEKLSSRSMTHLEGLGNLRVLDASYSRGWTDDAAMKALPELPSLQRLILTRHVGGGCTSESLLEFRRKLPALRTILLTDRHPLTREKIGGQPFVIAKVSDQPWLNYYSRTAEVSDANGAGIRLDAELQTFWQRNSFEYPELELNLRVEDSAKFENSGLGKKVLAVDPLSVELLIDGRLFRPFPKNFPSQRPARNGQPVRIALGEYMWVTDTEFSFSGRRAVQFLKLDSGKHKIQVRYTGIPDLLLSTGDLDLSVTAAQKTSRFNFSFADADFGKPDYARAVAAQPVRANWSVDEFPLVNVCLKNLKRKNRALTASTDPSRFSLLVNGQRYSYRGFAIDWIRAIESGQRLHCQLQLDGNWFSQDKKLQLEPGDYRIQVLSLHIQGIDPVKSREFTISIRDPKTLQNNQQTAINSRVDEQSKAQFDQGVAEK